MKQTESQISALILREYGGLPHIRLFRNQVGVGWVGQVAAESLHSVTLVHPRRVSMGLMPGSADLIGWRKIRIDGTDIAQFLSIEVKASKRSKAAEAQKNWAEQVESFGGLSRIVIGQDDPWLKGLR